MCDPQSRTNRLRFTRSNPARLEIGFKLEFIFEKILFRFTIPSIMPKQKQFVNYSPVKLIYFNNKKKRTRRIRWSSVSVALLLCKRSESESVALWSAKAGWLPVWTSCQPAGVTCSVNATFCCEVSERVCALSPSPSQRIATPPDYVTRRLHASQARITT